MKFSSPTGTPFWHPAASPNAYLLFLVGMRRVLLSWSSGKDSAWVLYLLRQMAGVEVVALVTAFNRSANRVAMHAVRRTLVEAQAERASLPLWSVELPSPCSNTAYEDLMTAIWQRAVDEEITEIAFGDLFLLDIRNYRERQLQGTHLAPLFPVWELPTRGLAKDMIRAGVKAKVTCVDPAKLDRSFAGREFDDAFIESLPPIIDPCGENGEFHTFVYDSPVFSRPISIHVGEIIERDGFVFADVLPRDPKEELDSTAGTYQAGLCATCLNAKVMVSDRGSAFLRCMLSDQNSEFPRYPRLPVLTCSGWSAAHHHKS
jgi:uncharacterized protein (TIGR00290 family)